MVRAGVIGAGAIARQGHIPGLRASGCEVVAICDPDRERAAELAASEGIPVAVQAYGDLLALDGIDIVTIATPNVFHAPIAVAALRSGRHVLCEKPIATTSQDALEMARLAEASGLLLGVNHHMRFDPGARALRRQLEAGSLGDVYHVDARWIRQSGIPGYGSWFTRRELAGAGALFDIGVHMLDLGLHLIGFPRVTRVRGTVGAHLGPRRIGLGGWGDSPRPDATFDVDDTAVAILTLAGGATLALHVAWAAFGIDEWRVAAYGTRGGGALELGGANGHEPLHLFDLDREGAIVESAPVYPTPAGNPWLDAIGHFVRAVRGEETLRVGAAEAIDVLRVLEAIIASSSAGRELSLD